MEAQPLTAAKPLREFAIRDNSTATGIRARVRTSAEQRNSRLSTDTCDSETGAHLQKPHTGVHRPPTPEPTSLPFELDQSRVSPFSMWFMVHPSLIGTRILLPPPMRPVFPLRPASHTPLFYRFPLNNVQQPRFIPALPSIIQIQSPDPAAHLKAKAREDRERQRKNRQPAHISQVPLTPCTNTSGFLYQGQRWWSLAGLH